MRWETDLLRLAIIVSLIAAALWAATACAQKSESTAVAIPTATPVDTPTPVPTTTRPTNPTTAPTATTVRPSPSPVPTRTPTPSPTPTPEPSLATAKAAALLVSTLGINAREVSFDTVKAMQWPNAAIGCPEPGRAYADVIVPGWMIILRYDSKLYEYHADREGEEVTTCDPKLVRTYGAVNFADVLMLANVSRVEIFAIDPEGLTPVPATTITSPSDVAGVVASLQIDLPLYERKPCAALLQVSFVMGDKVASVFYACTGDGTVLRAGDGVTQGREARAPTDFQRLINTALANRPFPTSPGQ